MHLHSEFLITLEHLVQVGAAKEASTSRASSSTLHSEDIMQTLLVHEPKAGSSRLPDQESSDESDRDVDSVSGAAGGTSASLSACLPACLPFCLSPSVCLALCPSVSLSESLCLCPYIYMSVSLPHHLSLFLSLCLCVCLSLSLSIFYPCVFSLSWLFCTLTLLHYVCIFSSLYHASMSYECRQVRILGRLD